MNFEFSPEQEAFRMELRTWLAENLPDELRIDPTSNPYIPNREVFERRRVFQKRLAEARWIGVWWPREYGGRGAGLLEQFIYDQEWERARAPMMHNYPAINQWGPTLLNWGTPAQKERFLRRMLTGEDSWCQGYSEPNAGSDLAGLQTRAVIDGDSFVVNGQKVWTSLAHRADWQVLLVRTDPNAPKHKGISYLLVNMKTPGVTVRPLVQITGEAGFNEVFYDNVRQRSERLVGERNQGWQVSIATLMFERVSGGTRHPVERTINELVELSKKIDFDGTPAHKHPYVRQKLAQFVSESRCVRLSRYRSLTSQLKGKVPGPESSFGKLFATELNLRVAMFADEMLGAYAGLDHGSPGVVEGGRWAHRILAARGLTIAAGSSEIQHNIIGERVLGLPKG